MILSMDAPEVRGVGESVLAMLRDKGASRSLRFRASVACTRDLLNVALRGRYTSKSIPDEWMVGSVCTLATLPPAAQLLHYSGPKPWTAAGDINAK